MTEQPKKLAILHSRATAPGTRHHMVSVIADDLAELGVEVVHLYGTGKFVPADAIFVHVDRSVVPEDVVRFAARYPRQINPLARDIRKRTFADGLLEPGDSYGGPVIVKSDLNYGGAPELTNRTLAERAMAKAGRMLTRQPEIRILTKSDYRVFPSLSDVPPGYFGLGNVVQKLMLEKDGEKNVLREYIFLGNRHFENVERSASEIITEDEHVSCQPFTPHPRLLNMRRRLKLDYGKIDYVMAGGEPFIFDANKTMGLGDKAGTEAFGEGNRAMLRAFAEELLLILSDPDYRFHATLERRAGGRGRKGRPARHPHAARTAARA